MLICELRFLKACWVFYSRMCVSEDADSGGAALHVQRVLIPQQLCVSSGAAPAPSYRHAFSVNPADR